MGKLSKDRRDVYYRMAKTEGFRARSAYKLLQLDQQFELFASLPGDGVRLRAVDLCAAPGSWAQVLARRLQAITTAADGGKRLPPLIVAVDLQEMAPVEGVVVLQGDITSESTAKQVIDLFDGEPADLVVCDGAPDVSGLHDVDEYLQSQLLFAACRVALALLRPRCAFVAKVFRGEMTGVLLTQLRCLFHSVALAKPASSRVSSFESFVVCRDVKHLPFLDPSDFLNRRAFQAALWAAVEEAEASNEGTFDEGEPGHDAAAAKRLLVSTCRRRVIGFVACGDLSAYDSDTAYALPAGHEFQQPVQPTYAAPYIKTAGPPRRA